MRKFSVTLQTAATEIACEEIVKQAAFLSQGIRNVQFLENGRRIDFEAPEAEGEAVQASLVELANSLARALSSVERKVIFRSQRAASARFANDVTLAGVRFLGLGQAVLSGTPLRLMRYFDRAFEEFGRSWNADPLLTPTLIPSQTLSKCDYFRSFPHNVTFASHLKEDAQAIAAFRARYQDENDLDERCMADMARPEACLSPAVCYHVYKLYEGTTLPSDGVVHGICGKCFRYESSNLRDLRRLWDFTMREVVFLGSRQEVLRHRERSIEMMGEILNHHELAGEIRTASDPFFIAPDAVTKTFFQLRADSKFEISLMLPEGERLAAGSHNYHSDFFGRAFDVHIANADLMHSVCVAFGLERWVYAFLQQHGEHVDRWPDVVRRAPEFSGPF